VTAGGAATPGADAFDDAIAQAARALGAGDPLAALKHVALRDDPAALALRGIAMAQLGAYPRARQLLARAVRRFGKGAPVARARCVVAEAEVTLAMRDLGGSLRPLAAAHAVLHSRGDRTNAAQAQLVMARRLILLGRLDAAAAVVARIDARPLPPALRAVAELARAELMLRALEVGAGRAALERAQTAAQHARVPALQAEIDEARAALARPAARWMSAGHARLLSLDEVAALRTSDTLLIDACRRSVRCGTFAVPLMRRPVLFALARALAAAWPADVDRHALIADVFRTRRPDESHRARLRVEVGRLRAALRGWASIDATADGFAMRPARAGAVAILAPPLDDAPAALVALLADGAAWSTSALALAAGTSQRSVQRALAELEADAKVRAVGRGRARRWVAAPLTGFATILLLPSPAPSALHWPHGVPRGRTDQERKQ
jgi:hypothetical protein